MLMKDGADQGLKSLILALIKVGRGVLPTVVGAPRNLEGFAKMPHFETIFRQHENDFVEIGYSGWLKMANAFFKMSRSR